MSLRVVIRAMFTLLVLSGSARASIHDQKRFPGRGGAPAELGRKLDAQPAGQGMKAHPALSPAGNRSPPVATAERVVAHGAIAGEYDTPLGRVRIQKGQGVSYTGTLVAASALCPFKAGQDVLRATLLDDSLAGQMLVCVTGDACSSKEQWASMVLLASDKRLSGAVHVSGRECRGPFGEKGGVAFSQAQGSSSKKKPPSTSTKKNRLARVRSILQDGKAYLEEGEFEAARKRFEEAIRVDSNVPEAYNGVGVTFRMRNSLSEALDWYKKALLVDPDFGDAYYNMACVYALEGRREMALRYLKIAALNGYVSGDGIDADPDLESLRSDPEYRELRTKL